MIKLAVIGDVGSGKSHFARLLGYPVFNADQEVEKLYAKNKNIYFKLKKNLPKFIRKFPIDKQDLFKAIKKNPINLKKIIRIVHPQVRKEMSLFLKKFSKKKLVILDIPLYLENKINRPEDIIVYIESKPNKIMNHLKKRSNFNKYIYKILKKNQFSNEYKKSQSDFIIVNNFQPTRLKLEAKKLLDTILL